MSTAPTCPARVRRFPRARQRRLHHGRAFEAVNPQPRARRRAPGLHLHDAGDGRHVPQVAVRKPALRAIARPVPGRARSSISGRSFLTCLIVDDADYEVDGWLQAKRVSTTIAGDRRTAARARASCRTRPRRLASSRRAGWRSRSRMTASGAVSADADEPRAGAIGELDEAPPVAACARFVASTSAMRPAAAPPRPAASARANTAAFSRWRIAGARASARRMASLSMCSKASSRRERLCERGFARAGQPGEQD